MTTAQIEELERTGTASFDIPGEGTVELSLEEVHIHSKGIEGWEVEKADGVTVALDMRVTEELRDEGLAREFVNRVQNLRKAAGFDVVDRVHVSFRSAETVKNAVLRHDQWIRNETLASELEFSASPEGESIDTFEIAQDPVTIGVRRVQGAPSMDDSNRNRKDEA
jgi:isoleucyl-tRNA synthetase